MTNKLLAEVLSDPSDSTLEFLLGAPIDPSDPLDTAQILRAIIEYVSQEKYAIHEQVLSAKAHECLDVLGRWKGNLSGGALSDRLSWILSVDSIHVAKAELFRTISRRLLDFAEQALSELAQPLEVSRNWLIAVGDVAFNAASCSLDDLVARCSSILERAESRVLTLSERIDVADANLRFRPRYGATMVLDMLITAPSLIAADLEALFELIEEYPQPEFVAPLATNSLSDSAIRNDVEATLASARLAVNNLWS